MQKDHVLIQTEMPELPPPPYPPPLPLQLEQHHADGRGAPYARQLSAGISSVRSRAKRLTHIPRATRTLKPRISKIVHALRTFHSMQWIRIKSKLRALQPKFDIITTHARDASHVPHKAFMTMGIGVLLLVLFSMPFVPGSVTLVTACAGLVQLALGVILKSPMNYWSKASRKEKNAGLGL